MRLDLVGRIVLGTVIAVGASAASAEANGEYDARVCGASGCRTVEVLPPFGTGGAAPVPVKGDPPPAAFYTITITFARERSAPLKLVYRPEQKLIHGFGGWAKVGHRFTAGMRKTLRGITPFPA